MINNINYISKNRARNRLDEDYQRHTFIMEADDITVKSKGPQLYTLQDSLFWLLYNSSQIQLEEKYVTRPDLLAYDQYGDETLWYVILYVNNCRCFEDFTGPNVYVPSYDSITNIVRLQEPDDKIEATITE